MNIYGEITANIYKNIYSEIYAALFNVENYLACNACNVKCKIMQSVELCNEQNCAKLCEVWNYAKYKIMQMQNRATCKTMQYAKLCKQNHIKW